MTDLDAANKALTLLGVEPVGQLSDNTKAARTTAQLMDQVKRIVLAEFPWTFALKEVPLVVSAATPPAGYSHAWTYPGDAVNINRVFDPWRRVVPFQTVEGGIIATNLLAVNVEYVRLVTDLNVWRSDVAECFITRLASDAAVQLTGSGQLMSGLYEKYLMLLNGAKDASVVEEYRPFGRADHYVRVRS